MSFIEKKIKEAQVRQLMKKDSAIRSLIMIILTIIGAMVVAAAAAYGIYKFFTPDYLDDFEDDFNDDFDDNFFDEDDEKEVKAAEDKIAEQTHESEPEEDIFAE